MRQAIHESKADKEYHDAVKAFDHQDFDGFLKNFFLAIHSRYDIEQPVAQRYIRRKLGIINRQRAEADRLRKGISATVRRLLKRLAAEYLLWARSVRRST